MGYKKRLLVYHCSMKFFVKIIVFTALFFVFSGVLAFFLKDDSNSYSRVLRHEFYEQDNIDYLLCGASHVSHGLDTRIADKAFEKNVFNTGTPAQQVDGTVAILKQAVKLYKIEKVFFEMDPGIICSFGFKERLGHTADYIAMDFLKDPKIKFNYMLRLSTPKYYLNSILPIGKDKLMDLNPKKIIGKIKSVLSGKYFKYEFGDDKSAYAGKGCVLDKDYVPAGTFSSDFWDLPIIVEKIHPDIINAMTELADICKENNIQLVFYSMPATDFYLSMRKNYDDYIEFCRDFAEKNGCPYYDFNLCREQYLSLNDEDFSDDNHLNYRGVEKFTNIFCDFFTGKISERELFFDSYNQKLTVMDDRIFGLVLTAADDCKSFTINPVSSNVEPEKITYDIYIRNGNDYAPLFIGTSDPVVKFPATGLLQFRIISYVDGNLNNIVEKSYFSF